MAVRLPAIRPLLVAASFVSLAVVGSECVLRITAETPNPLQNQQIDSGGICEASRVVHHRLAPLRSTTLPAGRESGSVEIQVNAFGLRGDEVAVPKPPGVYRVLFLGDETVLGAQLDEAQTVSSRLQQLLQARTRLRVEVLNGATPGDCPLLAALRLRYSLAALQPDLILLHFDMSDVADDQRYRRYTRIDASGQPYACVHPLLDRHVKRSPWWMRLQLLNLTAAILRRPINGGQDAITAGEIDDPQAATAWLRDHPPDWDVYIEQSLSPIEDIHRLAEGTYAQLIVTTSPQPWQVSVEASGDPRVRRAAGLSEGAVLNSLVPFDAIGRFANRYGVRFCDASPAFRDFNEPARLYDAFTPQLSRFGHELYARHIADFLGGQISVFGGREQLAIPEEPLQTLEPAVEVFSSPAPTAAFEIPYYR